MIRKTVRIVTLQSLQVLSIYVTDQLKFETELNDKIAEGEMTVNDAECKSFDWAKVSATK
jgi:hypothetical protein